MVAQLLDQLGSGGNARSRPRFGLTGCCCMSCANTNAGALLESFPIRVGARKFGKRLPAFSNGSIVKTPALPSRE
jgi:hypothetical protein